MRSQRDCETCRVCNDFLGFLSPAVKNLFEGMPSSSYKKLLIIKLNTSLVSKVYSNILPVLVCIVCTHLGLRLHQCFSSLLNQIQNSVI